MAETSTVITLADASNDVAEPLELVEIPLERLPPTW